MSKSKSMSLGSGGKCVCPKCDYSFPHKNGIPCQEERCPKCGVKLFREGSYHHDLLLKKKNRT